MTHHLRRAQPHLHLVAIRDFGGGYGRPVQLIEDGQVQITEAIPHDRASFVEGLFIKEGFVYESQGLSGQSKVSVLSTRGCLAKPSQSLVVLLFWYLLVRVTDWTCLAVTCTGSAAGDCTEVLPSAQRAADPDASSSS